MIKELRWLKIFIPTSIMAIIGYALSIISLTSENKFFSSNIFDYLLVLSFLCGLLATIALLSGVFNGKYGYLTLSIILICFIYFSKTSHGLDGTGVNVIGLITMSLYLGLGIIWFIATLFHLIRFVKR